MTLGLGVVFVSGVIKDMCASCYYLRENGQMDGYEKVNEW
jgi:hypothetical protein